MPLIWAKRRDMSDTDQIIEEISHTIVAGPVVILVEPQLGENIGMAARAMMNCGLQELRLVAPRDAWPNKMALAASSGATTIIEEAKIFAETEDAVADLQIVYASTARPRDMTTEVVTPNEAALRIYRDTRSFIRSGILFGKEAKGLKNDDISLANAIVTVPLNPRFTSLNLAQAVFVMGYEWFRLQDKTDKAFLNVPKETRLARKSELRGLFDHLENELENGGFFHVREKKTIMVRNIRNVLQRAKFTEQEIRTFRGIITSLTKFRGN